MFQAPSLNRKRRKGFQLDVQIRREGGMKTEMWTWMRVRFWTALVVLGAYGYFWLNTPQYLTWWKRTVNTLIEKGCDMLSYPWGDRIESTVGNFGIWVQITLAILIFRTIIGTVLILIRATGRR